MPLGGGGGDGVRSVCFVGGSSGDCGVCDVVCGDGCSGLLVWVVAVTMCGCLGRLVEWVGAMLLLSGGCGEVWMVRERCCVSDGGVAGCGWSEVGLVRGKGREMEEHKQDR